MVKRGLSGISKRTQGNWKAQCCQLEHLTLFEKISTLVFKVVN